MGILKIATKERRPLYNTSKLIVSLEFAIIVFVLIKFVFVDILDLSLCR